jgi:hypothetical protein
MEPSQKRGSILFLALLFAFVPTAGVQAEDPWQLLRGFRLIPDSPARIEERYIAALFVNPDKQQLAVVVFHATCGAEKCRVNRRAAYSVFNSEGLNIRRYVDPSEPELQKLVAEHVGA